MMMHHYTVLLSRPTFTEVQDLHRALDLEYSKATFTQNTPAYESAQSN